MLLQFYSAVYLCDNSNFSCWIIPINEYHSLRSRRMYWSHIDYVVELLVNDLEINFMHLPANVIYVLNSMVPCILLWSV
jgi:hypothetical protein